jgi:hypothetical protein
VERITNARMENKEVFDSKHKLRPVKIEVEDYILVFIIFRPAKFD